MEQILSIEDARPKLGELVDGLSHGTIGPVMITKRGRSFAVLVSRDDFAVLNSVKQHAARADLLSAWQDVSKLMEEKGLKLEDLKELLPS
jgi:prevent-host-death family protein